jgi:hypothetical protein
MVTTTMKMMTAMTTTATMAKKILQDEKERYLLKIVRDSIIARNKYLKEKEQAEEEEEEEEKDEEEEKEEKQEEKQEEEAEEDAEVEKDEDEKEEVDFDISDDDTSFFL